MNKQNKLSSWRKWQKYTIPKRHNTAGVKIVLFKSSDYLLCHAVGWVGLIESVSNVKIASNFF